MMVSSAAKDLEQPAGGYLNPHAMDVLELNTDDELYPPEMEDITGGELGMAVDYLTRYQLTGNLEESFKVSLRGAERAGKSELAKKLLNEIHGLDKRSVIATLKLVSFDVFIRNPIGVLMGDWNPTSKCSDETVHNIQTMTKRCLKLFDKYGPAISCHLIFPGAYTRNISSGDADYMTADTIWDIKTTKKDVGIQDTYQMLLYYLLSQHSEMDYSSINRLGIFNPRLNKIHIISIADIDCRIINYISKYIFCYDNTSDTTLKDLKDALDSRPHYPHYPSKKGTSMLLDELIQLNCPENEKLYILRTTKAEFIRMKLAEQIKNENLKTTKEIFEKEVELMRRYNEKPNHMALKLFMGNKIE